ncbi:MAG: NUDIX hydrolase [Rhodospirillales bacterium]|nr:NUDIX hydrolase [Rhodospirillales bacterium]
MTREYPENPRVGVGVVVLGPEGVLLVRRAKPPSQGQWSLPGGAQKLGETVFEAARREVFEETGLKIEVMGLIDVVDSIQPDEDGKVRYHYTLVDVFAAAELGQSKPQAGDDAAEAAWMPLADIPSLGLWSETERIISLAAEMHAALDDAEGF